MMPMFALLGAGLGAAVMLIVTGLQTPVHPPQPGRQRRPGKSVLRATTVLAAVAVVGAATRWPVAAAWAGVAAWALPAVVGPDRAHRRGLERVEAIAAWAEDLAGTLRAAAGVEQAILQTATVAPAAIRTELQTLAGTIRAGIRLPQALRAFAAELADPTADMVVNVLLQAAAHQARDIAVGLAGVGRAARRQAASRMRIATGRARTRAAVRIVVTVVLVSVVGLVVFAHDFLHPYGSPLGQLILAVLGAMFAGALRWMIRTGRTPDLPRILTGVPAGTEVMVP